MENRNLIRELLQMQTPEDLRIFEKRISELTTTQDPNILSNLIDLFENNCSSKDALFTVLHAIESYPNEIYVKTILKKINYGLFNYPEWIARIVSRIFNEDKCRALFISNLRLASKNDLLNLFQTVEQEYPHHKNLISELRKEMKYL